MLREPFEVSHKAQTRSLNFLVPELASANPTNEKKKTFISDKTMVMGSCFCSSQFACEESLQCPKQNGSVVGIGVWV